MARLSFGQRFRNPKEQEYVGFFLAPEDKIRLRKLAHFADQKVSEYIRSLISAAWREHQSAIAAISAQISIAEVSAVDEKTAEILDKFLDLSDFSTIYPENRSTQEDKSDGV